MTDGDTESATDSEAESDTDSETESDTDSDRERSDTLSLYPLYHHSVIDPTCVTMEIRLLHRVKDSLSRVFNACTP